MADATGDDAMADAGDDANEGAGDAAPRGGRRRHELDALDRELRSKWRRSAVVQDETSVYASPLLALEKPTVRAWLRGRGLEQTAENIARAREAIRAMARARWAHAEVTRMRKTQRLYDVEVRGRAIGARGRQTTRHGTTHIAARLTARRIRPKARALAGGSIVAHGSISA